MTPQQLHRIKTLHETLVLQKKTRAPVTAENLLNIVSQRVGGVWNVKTIRRDLDYMRKKLSLPIKFDVKRNTFFYDGDAHLEDATIDLLSHADTRMLLVARQAAEHFHGTPWHAPLREMYDRLLAAFPAKVIEDQRWLVERVRFEGPQVQPVKSETWNTLMEALENQTCVTMAYRSGSGGKKDVERRFDPYAMIVVNRHWQVVGYDHHHRAVRTFLVARIRQLKPTHNSFRIRSDFDLDGHLQEAVSGQHSAGVAQRVHLRFTAAASDAGESQVWQRKERRWRDVHNRLNIEFKTAALFMVEREVLAWAGRLEVLSPPELRESLARAVQDLAASLGADDHGAELFVADQRVE